MITQIQFERWKSDQLTALSRECCLLKVQHVSYVHHFGCKLFLKHSYSWDCHFWLIYNLLSLFPTPHPLGTCSLLTWFSWAFPVSTHSPFLPPPPPPLLSAWQISAHKQSKLHNKDWPTCKIKFFHWYHKSFTCQSSLLIHTVHHEFLDDSTKVHRPSSLPHLIKCVKLTAIIMTNCDYFS